MDVNGDGKLDVLSGSYSRMEQDMAGLFQVLYGEDGGGFRPAEVLKGTDGEPLILPRKGGEEDDVIARICTRPTAVDFDGDGDLDLVSGNFAGTFFLFEGEGAGKFAPAAKPLVDPRGNELRVDMHSDPVFHDWDADGDLDLISGSAMGGVFLATNSGTRQAPRFEAFTKLLAPTGHGHGGADVMPDDAHLTAPQSATRIWVDDVNGDGKADLLVGDSVTLILPAEGVELATAKAKYAELMERQSKIAWPQFVDGQEPDAKAMEAAQAAYEAIEAEAKKIVDRQMTGFVWVYHRK